MREKRYQRLLLLTIVICAVFSFAEVFQFFSDMDVSARIFMAMLNSLRLFTLAPAVTPDLIMLKDYWNSSLGQEILYYGYSICIFIAPLCTATAVIMTFFLFLRNRMSSLNVLGKKCIYIFGYNEKARIFEKNIVEEESRKKKKAAKVVWIIDKEISKEEQSLCMRAGTHVILERNLMAMNERDLKLFFATKVRMRTGDTVILIDEAESRNLEIYLAIQGYLQAQNAKKMRIHDVECCFFCEHEAVMDRLRENVGDTRMISTVAFNLHDTSVRKILKEHPILSGNLAKYGKMLNLDNPKHVKVHILQVGLGRYGKSIFQQALMQSVITGDNSITIDVVDCNIDKERERLTKYWDDRVFRRKGNTYELVLNESEHPCNVRLNFWEADVNNKGFLELVKRLHGQEENPVTYAAICVDNMETSLQCLKDIEELLTDIPIIIQVEEGQKLIDTITDKNVYPFGNAEKTLTLENVLSREDVLANRREEERRFYASLAKDNVRLITEWHYAAYKSLGPEELCNRVEGTGQQEMLQWSMEELERYEVQEKGGLAYELSVMEHRSWMIRQCLQGAYYAEKGNLSKADDKLLPFDKLLMLGSRSAKEEAQRVYEVMK